MKGHNNQDITNKTEDCKLKKKRCRLSQIDN